MYLKNTKKTFWKKFQETYPNGLKRTTFYCQLKGNRYQYREDMRGLCAICNTYRYEVFECLKNLIQKEINSIKLQVKLDKNWYININKILTWNSILELIYSTCWKFTMLPKKIIWARIQSIKEWYNWI